MGSLAVGFRLAPLLSVADAVTARGCTRPCQDVQ